MNIKISIITVTFNAETTLKITLDSVRKQSYKNYELIIIDGNSRDNTKSIIEDNKDIINYYISEKDNGIYDAMNKGIVAATGDFCVFLNAGDAFASPDILKMVNFEICQFPYNDIYIGYAEYVNGSTYSVHKPNFKKLPYAFCHQAIFFRLSMLKKNLYDISYKLSGDSELLYRLLEKKISYVFMDIKVVLEEAGAGATESNLLLSSKELYSIPYLVSHTNVVYRYYRMLKIHTYLMLKKIIKLIYG